MKVTVAIPAYNSSFSLINVVDRMVTGTNQIDLSILLISTGIQTNDKSRIIGHGATMAACNRCTKNYNHVIWDDDLVMPSVASAWNEAIMQAYITERIPTDLLIISNDDIYVNDGDIDKVAAAYMSTDDHTSIISVAGPHMGYQKRLGSHGYSFFGLTKACVRKVGMFDENIFPAYLEDCDYSWRWSQSGLVEANVPDTETTHVGSGSAFRAEENEVVAIQHHHQLNFFYYDKKWGGVNGQEKYDWPFNDKSIPMYISPENRHHPYGDNDREDIPSW